MLKAERGPSHPSPVAEAAEERRIPVALLIDELQYFSQKELGALIMAMHKMQHRSELCYRVRRKELLAEALAKY